MVFCVFRGPGAVKQEKTSQNVEMKSKINFIFGARKIIFFGYYSYLGWQVIWLNIEATKLQKPREQKYERASSTLPTK